MRRGAAAAAALALAAGCGSAGPSARDDFVRGLEQIRGSHGAVELHARLAQTLAALRRKPSAPGKQLAIQGFAVTLRGVDAQVDLIENDSGELEAAARDSRRANRYRERGSDLLRRAGRAFGVRVGTLGGY
jgi:hypothetical protein